MSNLKHTEEVPECLAVDWMLTEKQNYSHTGRETRAAWVKTRNPNR